MRLEPVFLVAPKPKPPSMPTRRAFLLAGGTFCAGAVLGGACGYSVGAAAGGKSASAEPELAKSGDVELDELRRLAVKAPIEELVEKRLWFTNSLTDHYRKDPILWRGIDRLAQQVMVTPGFPERRIFSRYLAQVIEKWSSDAPESLVAKCRELRSVK